MSSVFDANFWSSFTTVCGMSSRFVQRTVVPTGTVMVAGEKLKLSIFTSTGAALVLCRRLASLRCRKPARHDQGSQSRKESSLYFMSLFTFEIDSFALSLLINEFSSHLATIELLLATQRLRPSPPAHASLARSSRP